MREREKESEGEKKNKNDGQKNGWKKSVNFRTGGPDYVDKKEENN